MVGLRMLEPRVGFGARVALGELDDWFGARVALEELGGWFAARDEANSRDALFRRHIVFIFVDMFYI